MMTLSDVLSGLDCGIGQSKFGRQLEGTQQNKTGILQVHVGKRVYEPWHIISNTSTTASYLSNNSFQTHLL